ncbi:MAG: NADH:ubiquinone reductase (Na(+)-transporting) subunit C [Bacteroidetes bacterium]|nr:NADH:ubiquinone reductase (Na(+)-transporting) subunit C [Bacteroidota bacterium]
MALNKESNAYTFGFAIALVIVVGTILASLSLGLKDKQEKNGVVKKKMDILKAMLPMEEANKIDRSNAEENFNKYVDLKNALVLDMNGKPVEGNAFDIDIKKDYKNKTLKESDKKFPLFVAQKDGKKLYVIPIIGKGLWGPIWGNLCIGEDMRTVVGASFGHQGETPGLGAEITQQFFIDRWIGETILDENGDFTPFEIVKDGSGPKPQKVDGITGGTITSKGVEEMANRGLSVYATYFKSNMQ